MPAKSPVLTLNNGVDMPALGLGVFLTPPAQTAAAVEAAIADGYRLVDTAAAYGNEREVGAAIGDSGVPRSELFVTTKLWMSDYGRDATRRAFDTSLRKLQLDYLDLYLLHWPAPSMFDATVDAYQVAESLLADGRVRAIGVSNFNPAHLRNLIDQVDVVPAVNQIELHPFFTQPDLVATHRELGIVTQAWSPIGGVFDRNPGASPDTATNPLTHPVIVELAAKHRKTPAQIILRWHLQVGHATIPKSVRPDRIAENIDIFDFSLTDAETSAISQLDTGARAGGNPESVDANTYDIAIDAA
jgi:diketogulonate reductase-like aldo/keto reductase